MNKHKASERTEGAAVGCSGLLAISVMQERRSDSELAEQENPVGAATRKGEHPESEQLSLKFSDFVRSLSCSEILEGMALDKMRHEVQRCKSALCQWQEAGFPDLGGWPDRNTDLLEYSYNVMMAAANDKLSGGGAAGEQSATEPTPRRPL